jgi:hypothetical protein
MSDGDYIDGRDDETLLAARREIADACAHYSDGFEVTAGALVTGFVAIMEMSLTGGGQRVIWAVGNGDPDTRGALNPWEVEGLLREALNDLRTGNVSE